MCGCCLHIQLDSLERNETELNTIMEKKLAHQLRDVTEATSRLYGNDLQIAERLLSRLLSFETQQSGFGLTATQDAHFNEVRRRTHDSNDPFHSFDVFERGKLFRIRLVRNSS